VAERGVQFTRPTARRIVDAIRLAEGTPRDETGLDVIFPSKPRAYRPFELTEALVAGGTADVNWLIWNTTEDGLIDTGLTGEVTDHLDHAWGLPGDRGEAVFVGGKWVVTVNPGQGVYYGTFASDTTESPCNIDIGEETVSALLRAEPASGQKYASGTGCYVAHSYGNWEIISVLGCTVDA